MPKRTQIFLTHQKQTKKLSVFLVHKNFAERFSKLRISYAREGSAALPRTRPNTNTAKINFNKSYKIETKAKNIKEV